MQTKTRMNPSQLKACRVTLEAKREELIKSLEAQRAEVIKEREAEEGAVIEFQIMAKDFVSVNMEIEMRTLAEVELSLKRLDNGTYGLCGSCHAEISAARMKALPWTRVCVNCAGGGVRKRPTFGSAHEPTERANAWQE